MTGPVARKPILVTGAHRSGTTWGRSDAGPGPERRLHPRAVQRHRSARTRRLQPETRALVSIHHAGRANVVPEAAEQDDRPALRPPRRVAVQLELDRGAQGSGRVPAVPPASPPRIQSAD